MARNYCKLWMAQSTLGPNVIYNIELEQSDCVLDVEGHTDVTIKPVWISIDKGIIQNLLSQVGRAGTPQSVSTLNIIFDWPFPENAIVTYISPRERNNKKGWNKNLS